MVRAFFHRNSTLRYAALFALFAMALIIVAPLISVSLQKDPMAAMGHGMTMSGGHHDMSHRGMDHHDMDHHGMDHRNAGHPDIMPADHAEACGYCVLFAHVPAVLAALVLLLCLLVRRIRLRLPPPPPVHWFYSPRLRPETRAPPRRSCFTC